VCDGCGAVADLDEPGLDQLPISLPVGSKDHAGFQVLDYSVSVRGLCARCG
jgi:Fe2+ or Zn2+ uptake regulation protein